MAIPHVLGRIFRFDLDAYYLYRDCFESIFSGSGFEGQIEGFEFHLIDQIAHEKMAPLVRLWISGGYSKAETRSEEVVGVLNKHFSNGDACLLAMKDGVAAGMMWSAGKKSSIYSGFAKCVLDVEGFFVVHRTYVSEEFRGFGLQRYMNWNLKWKMYNKGFLGSFGFVGPKNIASVKNNMKTNQEFKLIYHLVLELPFVKINLYPKFYKEVWVSARKHEERWLPKA